MPSSRHRPDAVRARRVLAVAAIAVAVAQLAAGLALDTAPARVRFAQGARVLDQARALGGAPYVLLLGSSRFWQLDADIAAIALRETVGGDGPGLLKGAMPAGDPIVADYLLERLLAEGSHPRLIALEISPEIIANPSRWVAEHAVRFFSSSLYDASPWATLGRELAWLVGLGAVFGGLARAASRRLLA